MHIKMDFASGALDWSHELEVEYLNRFLGVEPLNKSGTENFILGIQNISMQEALSQNMQELYKP